MLTKTELIFKRNLRVLRASTRKSAYLTAKKIGIDKSYYYRLENDNIHLQPSFIILEKIAEYYQIPVHILFMN